jgi:acetyltransferase
VSESGALMTGVLDWARLARHRLFQLHLAGRSSDVDFGDVLDYLASDGGTSAILLHVESLRYARKFMSAARAAARSKPTLVLKAGRSLEDPARRRLPVRRAGRRRTTSSTPRSGAPACCACTPPSSCSRRSRRWRAPSRCTASAWRSSCNGAGPVVLALDALQYGGGHAAVLAPEATVARLRELVPEWRGSGPLNLRGDAPPERYRDVLELLLHDPSADAVLMIHAPNAVVDPADVARAVAPLAKASSRNVLACWLGGQSVSEARSIASERRHAVLPHARGRGQRLPADRALPPEPEPADAGAGLGRRSASRTRARARPGARGARQGPLPAGRSRHQGDPVRLRHSRGADPRGRHPVGCGARGAEKSAIRSR